MTLAFHSAHSLPGRTDLCYTKDGRFEALSSLEENFFHRSIVLLVNSSPVAKMEIFISSKVEAMRWNTFVVPNNVLVSFFISLISSLEPIDTNWKCVPFPMAILFPVFFISLNRSPPSLSPILFSSSAPGQLDVS